MNGLIYALIRYLADNLNHSSGKTCLVNGKKGGQKKEMKKILVFGLVIAIVMYGLVSSVSAEATIEEILDDYYGVGTWAEITDIDECVFSSGEYASIVVNKSSGYLNPTGWYEAGSSSSIVYNELHNPVVETDVQQFTANGAFGMYINSNEGTFHTQKSLNPDRTKHVRIFIIPGGNFVIGFEDKVNPSDEDYQDVVVELKKENTEEIPEFSTIAIPAIAVLGLFLFFNNKRKRENN